MTKHRDYIDHSKRCVEIANAALSSEERIMLLHIAETWLRLAETVEHESDGHLARVLH